MSLLDRLPRNKTASQLVEAIEESKQTRRPLAECMGPVKSNIYSAREACYALEDIATELGRLFDRPHMRRRAGGEAKGVLKETVDAINAAAKQAKKLADSIEDEY